MNKDGAYRVHCNNPDNVNFKIITKAGHHINIDNPE
jgi:hypothetical protein